ncbi:MAG: hypothetical protein JNK58_01215 [Phycisphaerae bacterium]|nr:hypothetical protein [Phycisphaerae bacterium]
MKQIMPWLKANLVSVISVAVAIIAAPLMLFFARGWEKSLHNGVEGEVASYVQQLDGSDVNYVIDPYLSGQQPISVKSPPNEATTNAVSSLLQGVVAGSAAAHQKAVEFNQADKPLLIHSESPRERLFPDNPDESTRLRLLDQLIERWPKANADLIAEFRAGSPPDAARVKAVLEDMRAKEIERRTTGGSEANLNEAERQQVLQLLGKTRLELYRQSATELSFYAHPSVFKNVQPWDRSKVLPMSTAWDWQHTYWVHRDVMKALALANTDSLGAFRPVYLGPVKIVESITVLKPGEKPGGGFGRDTGDRSAAGALGGGGGGGPTDGAAEVQRNYTLSHTGRAAAPVAPNPLYDIRYADIVLIADSSRLPQVIAAFGRVNFMTVVGVNLEEFDPVPMLSAGYDTGSDHLVRASLRVETIWLRSWMKQWMPAEVRKSLGIPDDPAANAPPAGSDATAPG